LTDADRRRSIRAIRREAQRFPLPLTAVRAWQADLWRESFRADKQLSSEQLKLSSNVEPKAILTTPKGPRKKVQRRATGKPPLTGLRKYDQALIDLLLRELNSRRTQILNAPDAELASMLSPFGKKITRYDIRPDRTPNFRGLVNYLKRSTKELPATLRALLTAEALADLEAVRRTCT
jgi:hypothetical protein